MHFEAILSNSNNTYKLLKKYLVDDRLFVWWSEILEWYFVRNANNCIMGLWKIIEKCNYVTSLNAVQAMRILYYGLCYGIQNMFVGRVKLDLWMILCRLGINILMLIFNCMWELNINITKGHKGWYNVVKWDGCCGYVPLVTTASLQPPRDLVLFPSSSRVFAYL